MGSDGQLSYHFESIGAAVTSINSFVNAMHDELHSVESTFNGLRSQWTSGAAENFDICRKAWNDGARDIAEHLLALAKSLDHTGNAMQAADQQAKSLFPS